MTASTKPTKYSRMRQQNRCQRCYKPMGCSGTYCEPCKQIRKEYRILGKPHGMTARRGRARDLLRSTIRELESKGQMDGLGSEITNDIRRWEAWLKEALELLTRKKNN